ncbi:MAG: EF-hand domain-containing protein [Candidatus Accumulibacter phosphatis]|jgi:Ca2+-binding EF-hand superfamily protein|uniref:EF-hand domain-containing protein n=1 Tax=Candidatus Accumulibacter sp. ACC012 TaxID=2823332 RepID=UPI0025BAAF5F|nr:EF-hand domain-containing protein [Candidatus Accumulibacter sp. ACC012]
MSSIGSVGSSNNSFMMQSTRQRPDTKSMAGELFAQLDTSGQGYLQKSDLQAAFDKISSTSSSSSSATGTSSTVDELFSTLDTNSNGKVSKEEFTDTLTKLQNDLEQQYQDGRMQKAMQAGGTAGMEGMGGRPPPPPPPGDGPSMSKDELSSTLNEIDTSDSRSTLLSAILQSFDQADSDGDGEVSFQEAMAFQQSSGGASGSAATASIDASLGAASSAAASGNSEAKVMMQIMKLMQAYNIGNEQSQDGSLLASLSVSA